MKVLVTGGAGFIGSHTCVALQERGHEILVLENYANSDPSVLDRVGEISGIRPRATQADIAKDDLGSCIPDTDIDCVVHFAALKSVAESIEHPLRYYDTNVTGTIRLLEWMDLKNVQRLVFSSSATVYGVPDSCPIPESAPLGPINPYGDTKRIGEDMIIAHAASRPGFNYALLRYFNPVGAHPSGKIGEAPHGIPSNLFPYLGGVLAGRYPALRVFGSDYPTRDGTGVRDYIHVQDLAEVHSVAMEALDKRGSFCINVGTGTGYSVLEVTQAFSRAAGCDIPFEFVPRRPGDAAEVYANTRLCRSLLGWQPKFSLNDMCTDAVRWYRL